MNLRDIKKDIEYVLSAFVDDCYFLATCNPSLSDDKLSEGQDWQFDYEEFVKWDQAHPTKMSASPATKAGIVETDDAENNECHPPVILGKTWRQVISR